MAYEELLSWSNQEARPLWQRDALRRIALTGELTDEDLTSLQRVIEKAAGLIADEVDPPTSLAEEHLSDASADMPRTILGAVGPVRHVDRLASDQPPLRFGKTGITLVYGANASGKSGYCRIAKELCGSHAAQDLRGNAFEDADHPPAEIDIVYGINGDKFERHESAWTKGTPPPSALARISIFDTACARIYVDSKRRINFLPYELDLLNKLALACNVFDTNYKEREERLHVAMRTALPTGFNDGTSVSAAIARLTPETSLADLPTEADLRALGDWNEDKQGELDQIDKEIATEPAIQTRIRETSIGSLETLQSEINTLAGVLDDKALAVLVAARQEMQNKEMLAMAATEELAQGLPISDIGSEPWRLMLRYARDFAGEVFADRDEPRLATGEACVLCQQTLSDDADERMRRFDAFITDKASTESEEARRSFNEQASTIGDLRVRSEKEVLALLEMFASTSEHRTALSTQVSAYFAALSGRLSALQALIREELFDGFEGFDPLPERPTAAIDSSLGELKTEISALEEQGQDQERLQRLNARRFELLDQKRLSETLQTFLERRTVLEERRRTQHCRNMCQSRPVSLQINARRRAIMTPTLKTALEVELSKLKLDHLPLDMTDRVDAGDSLVEVSLTAQKQVAKNSDILSEGEQRALALSCFLAELTEVGSQHGIIVDDPVSSLDHARMEAVAERLAAEAASGRQVIIFTHSILFHSMVQSAARKLGVSRHYEWMTSLGGDTFGVIDEAYKPWQIKKPPQRIQDVRSDFAAIKKAGYDPTDQTLRPGVVSLYAAMRETWERAVEDIVFNGVLQRFRPEVMTQRLEQVSFDPSSDYPAIFEGMKRCSHYSGHDQAEDLPTELPSEDQIAADIEALDDFVRAARAKQKALDKAPKYEHGPEPEFI